MVSERQGTATSTRQKLRRHARRTDPRSWLTILICLAVQLAAPAPAHAWIGWLDRLSGPGPFWGGEFDFRIVCFVDTIQWEEAAGASQAALSFTNRRPDARKALVSVLAFDGGTETPVTKLEDTVNLDYWTKKIAAAPQREVEMIQIADQLSTYAELVRKGAATEREVIAMLERAASLWRAGTQPHRSVLPGSVADASCQDHPKNDKLPHADQAKVLHGDRKPSPALILNVRQLYANWSQGSDTPFAPGQRITMTVIEPKFSWPLTGRFDFLEGQAGIGRYWMGADGFANVTGWIVEPVRFDLHLPSRFSDGKPAWTRILLAFSYTAGVVLYPEGFPADVFNTPGSSPPIAGSEAIFQQGIVINFGRMFTR
jgi:hypothetical protein